MTGYRGEKTAVWRFLENGRLDTGFYSYTGTQGYTEIDMGGYNRGLDIAAGNNGEIYVTGTGYSGYAQMFLVKYKDNCAGCFASPTATATATIYTCVKAWQTVGTPGFSSSEAYNGQIKVYEGVPYVAYAPYTGGNLYDNYAEVRAFVGSNWVNLGDSHFFIGDRSFSMDVSNEAVYFAYLDYNDSYKLKVMKYESGVWTAVGAPLASAGSIYQMQMRVSNGVPYIVYNDSGLSYKLTVQKYNGLAWEYVGTPGFTNSAVVGFSMEVNNDRPYIAYIEWINGKASVMEFNGTYWSFLGAPAFTTGQAGIPEIMIANNVPYIAFADANSDYKVSVMVFNGVFWNYLGGPGFSSDSVDGTITLDSYNGALFIAYSVLGTESIIMRFDGIDWSIALDPIGVNGTYLSYCIYEGVHFIAFSDYANYQKETVMKYDCQ